MVNQTFFLLILVSSLFWNKMCMETLIFHKVIPIPSEQKHMLTNNSVKNSNKKNTESWSWIVLALWDWEPNKRTKMKCLLFQGSLLKQKWIIVYHLFTKIKYLPKVKGVFSESFYKKFEKKSDVNIRVVSLFKCVYKDIFI